MAEDISLQAQIAARKVKQEARATINDLKKQQGDDEPPTAFELAVIEHLKTIKPPKDADAFTKIASVFLISVWMALNVIQGVEFSFMGNPLILNLDAQFLATLSYLAITAAGIILGTAVSNRSNKNN